MDQALALQQFGGDLTFLKQMCLKFISSGELGPMEPQPHMVGPHLLGPSSAYSIWHTAS